MHSSHDDSIKFLVQNKDFINKNDSFDGIIATTKDSSVVYQFSHWLYNAAFEGSPELRKIYEGTYPLPKCEISDKTYEYFSSQIAQKILRRSWIFMLEDDKEIHNLKKTEIKVFRVFLEKASKDEHICIVLRK